MYVRGFIALILAVSLTIWATGAGRILNPSRGLASYYDSEKYAGRRTASGEPFDPRAFTGASWDYFGHTVTVTSLTTGRSATIRVNDRGPAKRLTRQGRIIDLSEAAYRYLGDDRDFENGLMPVEVRP